MCLLPLQDDALEEAAFEDVNAICVRRHKLEAWVSKPFLERTLPGCLLRLSLGERTSSRGVTQKLYMLAQVSAPATRAKTCSHATKNGSNTFRNMMSI